MPWDRSTPTDPKYRTKAHRDERAKYVLQMARDGHLICQQPVCVMPSRTIERGMPWHLGHDETGTQYIGPVCAACNVKDAAVRANARSHGKPDLKRWPI